MAVDVNSSSTSSSEEEDIPEADRCWCPKFALELEFEMHERLLRK
jgi:hypothetical protein